ncbi:hypothetical protein [Guptibacillus algicola]|uniref:hypothetical protein n=1 Tax=Guptibacillus algicola TaxID=225844 RepID=UPI001CD2E5F8|nr:hypothetical protein [Alkalihalobacillus algicola]MCA0989402.1 hypothetical protein [Alkalihalobacillus algicola]
MIGFLLSDKEVKEMEYLLKREMEEMLMNLDDDRIEKIVKRAMEERYRLLLGMYKRTAPTVEVAKYIRILKKDTN